MLLSIAGGSDLGLFEINEAAALVSDAAHAEANIIFGATIDDALGDEVRVTVIAAGFDGGVPKRQRGAAGAAPGRAAAVAGRDPGSRPGVGQPAGGGEGAGRCHAGAQRRVAEPPTGAVPAGCPAEGQPVPQKPKPTPYGGDDDLDIPDFLK